MKCQNCKQEVQCTKHPEGKLDGYWIEGEQIFWIICRDCEKELDKLDEDFRGAIIHFCTPYRIDLDGTKQKPLMLTEEVTQP